MASYDDPNGLKVVDEMMIELFNTMHKDCVPILISNKCDIEEAMRTFSVDDLLDLGEKHAIDLVYEVSVETDEHVEDVMYEAACHANHFRDSFLQDGIA